MNDIAALSSCADEDVNTEVLEQVQVEPFESKNHMETNVTESAVERLKRELEETRGELAETKDLLGDSRNEVSTLKALRKKIVYTIFFTKCL